MRHSCWQWGRGHASATRERESRGGFAAGRAEARAAAPSSEAARPGEDHRSMRSLGHHSVKPSECPWRPATHAQLRFHLLSSTGFP
jgi:hypothetical protein